MSDTSITLGAAIGPNDELITVSAAATSHNTPFTAYLDSEAITVIEGTQGTAWRVRRGQNDTIKANHANGATLTIVSPNPVDRGSAAAAPITQSTLQTNPKTVTIVTGDTTLGAADSGKVFVMNSSGTHTFTLPAASTAGLSYHFTQQQVPASGAGLTVHPVGTDVMRGNGFTPAAAKGAVNTQSTGRIGDAITIVSDGAGAWYIQSVNGTWARES